MLTALFAISLIWLFTIAFFYFYNNPHFLGINSLEEAGYLLSERSLHFLIFFGIVILGYTLFYFYNSKKKYSKKIKSVSLSIKKLLIYSFFITLGNYILLFIISNTGDTSLLDGLKNFGIKGFLSIFYLVCFTLANYGIGNLIFSRFKLSIESRIKRFIFSILVGLIVLFLILFIISILGIFNSITLSVLSILLVSIGISRYKNLVELSKIEFEINLKTPFTLIFMSIIAFIFANGFLDSILPLGVGWDDLTRYINYPKLLADTGTLPSGNYGWPAMLFSSIGFGIFNNEWGNILLFMTSYWFQAFLLGIVVAIGKQLKTKQSGLLAALLFFSVPFVVNHTVFDSKTDIQLTTFVIGTVLLVLNWFKLKRKILLIISGALLGMAVGIKITAFVSILLILLLVIYKIIRFTGVFGLGAMTLFMLPFVANPYIEEGLKTEVLVVSLLSTLLLTGLTVYFYKKDRSSVFKNFDTKRFLSTFGVIILGGLITFGPILVRNTIETNFKLSVDNLIFGQINVNNVQQEDLLENSASYDIPKINEEIIRYIGFEEDVSKYLLLPWNMTMNNNLGVTYIDIGFIFLGFLPIGLLLWSYFLKKKIAKTNNDKTHLFAIALGLSFFVWIFVGQGISWYAMPIFLFGYILIEYLLTQLVKYTEIKWNGKSLISLGVQVILMYFGFMMIMSYLLEESSGISTSERRVALVFIFILFAIPLGILIYNNFKNKKFLIPILSIIFVGILVQVGWRSYNRSHPASLSYINGTINSTEFIDSALYGYRYMGCISNGGHWIRDEFDCTYEQIDESRRDSNVYRISSFMPYFIEDNNLRMYEDSSMVTLNYMIEESDSYAEVAQKLGDNGFNYIIYDTNSKNIEQDPEGPVHQRANNIEMMFVDLFNSQEITFCFNDLKQSSTQFISLDSNIDSCHLWFRKDFNEEFYGEEVDIDQEDSSPEESNNE